MWNMFEDKTAVKGKMTIAEFQHLMQSEEIKRKFRVIIKELRKRVRTRDFRNVNAEIKFLPHDLNEMLSFLYKKCCRNIILKDLNNGLAY